MDKLDLTELLPYIDPASLDYQSWVNVGMALRQEGYDCAVWDEWSRADSRYHAGECARKWETFRGSSSPITGGTIVQMAREGGWQPNNTNSYELDWDSVIGGKEDGVVVSDSAWLEGKELQEPENWDPVADLVKYLETLFDSTENVGYVTKSWEKDGKYMPSKGAYDRTAGELIQQLNQCGGDIGAVLGDYNEQVGAWIRFNPLEGKGVKNENVTEYRYALVESDSMDIEKQNALVRELELPIACLVYSGGKSVHAIVRIEAASYEEYRKRVDYLYGVLKKNGMAVDTQNKNPSRLSRMPGVMRNGKKQFLIDTNIGKASWAEWKDWIESVNDDMPEPDNLAANWDNLPPLAPALIRGVLRQGHKMLIAGPSKAGKSYALIELCCAIAEGKTWLQWQCAQGKVLYVNLELDRASCLHRFRDIYMAMGWNPDNIANIDIWNLRGKSVPMDKLAPRLIRRALKKNYIAIIIDPIYKVITGDENSADQMAAFCNQFDKVCTELGAAVIYCHHHSKGAQGGKRSMDRASGSGVFARDPDALLDLIELEIPDTVYRQEENKAICEMCVRWLDRFAPGSTYSQDDACSSTRMQELCQQLLGMTSPAYTALRIKISEAQKAVRARTGWRIEGTLREFPKFHPVNLWFDYPRHHVDTGGALNDLEADEGFTAKGAPWKQNFSKKKTPKERAEERKNALETAYEACSMDGKVTLSDIAEYMGVSEKTVKRRVDESPFFWRDNAEIGRKEAGQTR
jgi:RecA-family ATPase